MWDKRTNTKMGDSKQKNISIITLNANKLTISIKGRDHQLDKKKRQDPFICCLQEAL